MEKKQKNRSQNSDHELWFKWPNEWIKGDNHDSRNGCV